jgi:hypothetical protein
MWLVLIARLRPAISTIHITIPPIKRNRDGRFIYYTVWCP